MGVTYVVQSATAVAGNLNFFRYIIVPIQDLVYLVMYLVIFATMRENIRFLKVWRSTQEIQGHGDLRRAVSAKLKMLTGVLVFITLYFVQFIVFDLMSLFYLGTDFLRTVQRFVVQGFFEFVSIAVILFLMRAKKEMRFYSLDLNQLSEQRAARVIPLYKTTIRPSNSD